MSYTGPHAAGDEPRRIENLATFAHELRNRLQVILHTAHGMEADASLAPAVTRAGALITRQAAQMRGIVDDLLDAARSATGKLRLRSERLDLASVVGLAVETCQPVLMAGDHPVEVRLPPSAVHVCGDSLRLTQVIVNLVDNAAKYSDRHGEITVTLEREARDAVLRVSDNGIGMADVLLPHIFDLFVQAEDASVGFRGLGIGLNLVKRIVELHGGSVVGESAGLGRGSVFTVRLPLETTSMRVPRATDDWIGLPFHACGIESDTGSSAPAPDRGVRPC
jgi:signal transduction histidine kinase